jgi:hypothetical protein
MTITLALTFWFKLLGIPLIFANMCVMIAIKPRTDSAFEAFAVGFLVPPVVASAAWDEHEGLTRLFGVAFPVLYAMWAVTIFIHGLVA